MLLLKKNKKLPNVILLTVPKTGSTSLYNAFKQHNDICVPLSKETWYFTHNSYKTIDWYIDQFNHRKNEKILCDFVSTQIYSSGFAKKLKETLPNTKIILLLRDPIQRCISHYLHEVRLGNEKRTLEDALFNEKKVLKENKDKYSNLAYRDIGSIYKQRAEELLKVFPNKNVMIILLEELVNDQNLTLEKIWDFLEIPNQLIKLPNDNVARLPKFNLIRNFFSLPKKLYFYVINYLNEKIMFPQFVKSKSRVFRNYLVYFLDKFEDMSYEKVEDFSVDKDVINNLQKFYNNKLVGLEKIIGKKLSSYWNWFDEKK